MISMLLRGSGKIGGRSRTRTYDPLIKSHHRKTRVSIPDKIWEAETPVIPTFGKQG